MSVNSVQLFTKEQITGVTAKYFREPLRAMIRPRTPDNVKMQGPVAYIWGCTANEKRLAIPRGLPVPTLKPAELQPGTSGWKQRTYDGLRIWLVATDKNNDPHGDTRFPNLIEAVLKVLRAATAPAKILDPTDGTAVSWLMNMGEESRWDYDLDRTTGDQRILRSAALIEISALEVFQA